LANRVAFWAFLALYVALMFKNIPRVYNTGNFWAGYAVAVAFASAGLMAAVAFLWEDRSLLPLSGQYASFWVNDLFNLCLVVGLLCLMHQGMPAGYRDPSWWPYIAAALAVGAGCLFQFVFDSVYPAPVAWSPTHAAHSFGAVVVFVYLLLRGAPMLFVSDRGFHAFATGNWVGMALTVGVLAGIIAFFLVGPLLDMHMWHTYPWNAHGEYDWLHLRLYHKLSPTNPGWMSHELKQNAQRYLSRHS
jgi:hypothetical protein